MAKLSPNGYLSGSIMPAYMGASPYQSPHEVLDQCRAARAGEELPELDSLQIDIGNATENVILNRGLRMIGLQDYDWYNYQHDGTDAAKKHPALDLWYSDDGLLYCNEPLTIRTDQSQGIVVMNDSGEVTLTGLGVLEAKFTTVFEKPDDPPLYRGPIQLQAGMMCHDARWGILITCYGARKIVIHIFEPHGATQARITQACHEFEKHMSEGTYPAPTTLEQVHRVYSKPEDDTIELREDAIAAVDSYIGAKLVLKKYQEQLEQSSLALMGMLGNSTKAELRDDTGRLIKVSWPVRHSKAKPAKQCPSCNHELEPAKPESSARQKSITIKEVIER